MRPFLVSIFIFFVFNFSVLAREVKYPNLSGISNASLGYSVLNLALDKSGYDYQPSVDSRRANPERALSMLESGQIDVIDGGYFPELIEKFDLIYKPLDMGLTGWRVFIVRKEAEEKLDSVRNIDDLKSFTIGQGHGWYDVKVLKHAGLRVMTTPKLSNLFNMLQGKRFDLLSLGANEAYQLLDIFGEKNNELVINDTLILFYPFGRFFYVRKDDTELRRAIESGMEKALSDGSLLKLLKSHKFSRDAFKKAELSSRRVIKIDNPGLTEEFKSIDPKWWYKP